MPTSAFRCRERLKTPVAPVYIDGKLSTTLRGDHIVEEFREILNNYVAQRYGSHVLAETVV